MTQTRLSHILAIEPIFKDEVDSRIKQIDPIQLDELTSQYSDKEIGVILNYARSTVTQVRLRLGIKSFYEKTGLKRNVKGDAGDTFGGRKRLYSFNEFFFSTPETEAQAYFLGILAADGCVGQKLDRLELTLQERDIEVLLMFKRALGELSPELSYRVKDIGSNAYRLILCSKQMALDLNSWGLTPAKAHTLKIQKLIPRHLLRHFIRGYWDGDGWIGKTSFELLTASVDFANQLHQWAYDISGVCLHRRTRNRKGSLYPIIGGSTKHYLFLKILYEDCNYFMERKRDKFSRFWL